MEEGGKTGRRILQQEKSLELLNGRCGRGGKERGVRGNFNDWEVHREVALKIGLYSYRIKETRRRGERQHD